jgi:hypothetical protein
LKDDKEVIPGHCCVKRTQGEEYLLEVEEDPCSLFLNWKDKQGLVGLGTDRAHSMTGI